MMVLCIYNWGYEDFSESKKNQESNWCILGNYGDEIVMVFVKIFWWEKYIEINKWIFHFCKLVGGFVLREKDTILLLFWIYLFIYFIIVINKGKKKIRMCNGLWVG